MDRRHKGVFFFVLQNQCMPMWRHVGDMLSKICEMWIHRINKTIMQIDIFLLQWVLRPQQSPNIEENRESILPMCRNILYTHVVFVV